MREAVPVLWMLCFALACSSPHPNASSPEGEPKDCFKPLERVPPKYPQHAVDAEIAGRVLVEATVTPEGRVENVSVVASEPIGVFDEVAVAAVRQWRYARQSPNCPNPMRILIPFKPKR